eukprot:scaffold8329_cov50-Attheya_sp.AAC.1
MIDSRFVVLDKCPGVLPVGIGKIWRRLQAKQCLLGLAAADDAKDACSIDQVCTGLDAGITLHHSSSGKALSFCSCTRRVVMSNSIILNAWCGVFRSKKYLTHPFGINISLASTDHVALAGAGGMTACGVLPVNAASN